MGATGDDLSALALTEVADGVTIAVRVVPRAKRSAIEGMVEGALRVRIAAPPVDGAANKALLDFLAATLGIPKRNLAIITGEQGRQKRLRIVGLTATQFRLRLRDSRGRR